MSYTDQDILDLETTLEGIGQEDRICYRLVQPKSWVTPEGGLNFQNSVIVSFGTRLEKNGIKSWFGGAFIGFPINAPMFGGWATTCVFLQGPSIKTKLLMEEIKEKFQIEDVVKEEFLYENHYS